MPAILALRKQRWEDQQFKISLGYMVSSRAALANSETLSEKPKSKLNQN
jgi:hypothetical protein